MFSLIFMACTSNPPLHNAQTRMEYSMGMEWSNQPWEYASNPEQERLLLSATFEVDPSWPTEGAAMIFSGLWWKGELTVNGTVLPTFYGGLHQIEIDLGETLHSGKNDIQLVIEGPKGTSRRVTGGTLSSIDREGKFADIPIAPKILFRPEGHLSNFSMPFTNGQVTPIAWSTIDGNVEFHLLKDGKDIEELLSCVIVNGQSQCEAVPWNYPTWNIGDPNLVTIQARLKDSNGQLLDQMQQTLGIREISWLDQKLNLNAIPQTLLTTRMVHRRQNPTFDDNLAIYAQVGVNAIEIHGELIKQNWLMQADELGIATIIVPRCVGRANSKQGGSEENQLGFMQLQDQRLLWDTMNHASVLAFVIEGDTNTTWNNRSLWTKYLPNNLHNIPIFGVDLPARLFQIHQNPPEVSSQCQPTECAGSWLVETVVQPNTQTMNWTMIAEQYAKAHLDGALGGVIPTPRRRMTGEDDTKNWLEGFKKAQGDIQPTPYQKKKHRAHSQVIINAPANTLIELEVPTIGHFIQRTDGTGQAIFSVFYQGPAEFSCNGKSQSIHITADYWDNFQRQTLNPSWTCPNP